MQSGGNFSIGERTNRINLDQPLTSEVRSMTWKTVKIRFAVNELLGKLDSRFRDQNVPPGLQNTFQCNPDIILAFFFVKTFSWNLSRKLSLTSDISEVYHYLNELISKHACIVMLVKNYSMNTNALKMSYDVTTGHWPRLTTVNVGKIPVSL